MIQNKLCLEAFNKLDKPVYHPEEFFALGWQAAVEAMSAEFQRRYIEEGKEPDLIQINQYEPIPEDDKE